MQVNCTTIWLPKQGNTREEYEDAAYPSDSTQIDDCKQFRCAIADGATETSFSGLWASLLVSGYADDQPLDEIRAIWQEQIPTDNIPWYVEEKAGLGAYAALVGLTVNDDGSYICEAVGDSCFFHIRDGHILTSFPLTSPDDFDNRPTLICSKAGADSDGNRVECSGLWQPDDGFLLLTDAIAKWMLSQGDNGLEQIWNLRNGDKLAQFAEQHRVTLDGDGRPKLHNDDLTVLKLEIK